jgi:hypothetical protein
LLGLGQHRAAATLLDEAYRSGRRVGAEGTAALASAVRTQAKLLAGSSREAPARASAADDEVTAIEAETEGIAALRQGDTSAAIRAFDDAVERWQASGTTAWLARSLALRSRAHQDAGDRARAAASLGRARAVADQLGIPTRERDVIERSSRDPV